MLSTSAPALAASPYGTINLIGQLDLGDPMYSDVWGWVDPSTDKEYAFVGKYPSVGGKVFIIDVSNPVNPVLVKTLLNVPSFDIKTWQHYLYLCDGNTSGTDSQIWDIADPSNPTFEGYFPSCHNLFVDALGYLYLSYSTLRIYNLNPDPTAPAFVWTDGFAGGHDAAVVGNRLYDFHGYGGTLIYDVTNRAAPVLLGQIPEPSGIAYHHSGWTSKDGNYLFICDELSSATTADITVWEITNPAFAVKVDEYTDSNATVHNTYRIGDYLFTSFYVAGFRVFDVKTPSAIFLADEYDTSPGYTGNGSFNGDFGVYPWAPSGVMYASDMQNGLYLFTFTPPTPTAVPDVAPRRFALNQNHPNPFNPTTSITYEMPTGAHVTLTVFGPSGERVRTLVDTYQASGPHSTSWDGTNDDGAAVVSGVYFYRLQVGVLSDTKRMILLK
jgi:choice-of-anchor B domain-containing protein